MHRSLSAWSCGTILSGLAFVALGSTGCSPGSPGGAANAPLVAREDASKVSKPVPREGAEQLEVMETYSGICWMNPNDPNSTYVEQTFPIYSRSDFDAFVARIPEEFPSKMNPAPKNDDPLLESPTIDFEKNMAFVMLNPDTLSAKPIVLSIRDDADTIWVEAEYPAKPEGEAYPQGIGTYTVVIVPYSGERKALDFDIAIP